MIYTFGDILEQAREGTVTLKPNPEFPVQDLETFLEESADFRMYNDGNGVTFDQIYDFFQYNKEELRPILADELASEFLDELEKSGIENDFYISTIRALQGDVACVYGVVKDT